MVSAAFPHRNGGGRGIIVGVRWAAAAVVAVGIFLTGCAAPSCTACGRAECGALSFEIRWASGQVDRTCCPRCGLHLVAVSKEEPVAMTVRDFEDGRAIDPATAVFVEGSDVAPCARDRSGPPKDARGCCMKTDYDRCLPSLLAFAREDRARAFVREHGGDLATFEALRGRPR